MNQARTRTLNGEIWRLAIPAIVSNLAVPLLGLSDTTITGHMGSTAYVGAIAVGAMMINVAFWLFGFLRMGTTGLTAQAFGAHDGAAARRVLTQAFSLAAMLGAVFILLSRPIGALLLWVIEPDEGVAELAARYFSICLWGAPAMLCVMVLIGWFLGLQDTVRPMTVSISTAVLNVGASVAFVFGLGMGFEGVAYGTLLANWGGLILGLILALRFPVRHELAGGEGKLFDNPLKVLRRGSGLRRFFAVNTDIFFRSACIMGVSMGVTAIGARCGALILATNAVMMQFMTLFSYFMDGFAFAGEALCGRYAGGAAHGMLRRCVMALIKWGGVMAVLFGSIYFLFGREIISLITDRPDVMSMAGSFRPWLVALPPVAVAAFLFDGVFIGLTATRRMLAATLSAACVFFAIVLLVHTDDVWWRNATLWTAFLAYLLTRGLVLGCLTPGLLREHEPLPTDNRIL